MTAPSWVLFVLLVSISLAETHKSERYHLHHNTGYRTLDNVKTATQDEPATRMPEGKTDSNGGELSKIENMLNRLGENVCRRFKKLEEPNCCNTYCGHVSSGCNIGDDGSCSDWFEEKPLDTAKAMHPDNGELRGVVDEYYANLKNDLAELTQGISQCCSNNGGIESLHQDVGSLFSTVLNNQQVIMDGLGNLIKIVKGLEGGYQAREKKREKEWKAMAAQFQRGYQKMQVQLGEQFKKFGDLCPVNPSLRPVVGRKGEDEWKILQAPITDQD